MTAERTTIVLPANLREKVKRLAAAEGVSMGEYIRRAIEDRVTHSRQPLRIIGIASIDENLGRRSSEEEAVPEP